MASGHILGSCIQTTTHQKKNFVWFYRHFSAESSFFSLSYIINHLLHSQLIIRFESSYSRCGFHTFGFSNTEREEIVVQRTCFPLINHVMCGAGCAFDVVQFETKFSPIVNWRLLNVIFGGPVCWTVCE